MPISKAEIKQLKALENNFKLHTHTGWRSFNHDNALPDALVIDVEDEVALQNVMKQITALNDGKSATNRITVRAAAGGANSDPDSLSYSFSACAGADVIVRLAGHVFRQLERVDGSSTRIIAGGNLQIGELDKLLYNQFDLTLPTSSLIPYVTVAGLSATAGHGTGKDQPSFAGLIRAMTVCLPNGEIVRIDETHPDFETIRASHLGLFGIVLNVELECASAKKLHCNMQVCSVPEFIDKMKQGLYTKYPYVSAMYMPTYHADELTNKNYDNVIIYAWEPVDKSTPNMNNNFELAKFNQRMSIDLAEGLHVADLLRTFPDLTPYYMRYFASKIAIGGKSGEAVGPWYEMMHYQTAFPWDLTELGVLFEVSDAPKDGVHTPEMVAAFEKMVTTLTASAAKGSYPMVFAGYLRFLQGTNGGLSMSTHQEGHHVCSMDMTTAHHIPGFDVFAKTMRDYSLNELNAKLHWGKNIPDDVDFRKMYGESYNQFIDVLDRWHKEHGLSYQESPLLNHTFGRVLTPQHNVPAPATTPLTSETMATLSAADAMQMAQSLLNIVSNDQSDEAKALCSALNTICQRRPETLLNRVVSTLFSCCMPSRTIDTDEQLNRKTL